MATSKAITSNQISSTLFDLTDSMNEATAVNQLAFWIEEARESISQLEVFFSNRPELGQELRDSGITFPGWDLDQSRALLWLHNQLLSIHAQTKANLDGLRQMCSREVAAESANAVAKV